MKGRISRSLFGGRFADGLQLFAVDLGEYRGTALTRTEQGATICEGLDMQVGQGVRRHGFGIGGATTDVGVHAQQRGDGGDALQDLSLGGEGDAQPFRAQNFRDAQVFGFEFDQADSVVTLRPGDQGRADDGCRRDAQPRLAMFTQDLQHRLAPDELHRDIRRLGAEHRGCPTAASRAFWSSSR